MATGLPAAAVGKHSSTAGDIEWLGSESRRGRISMAGRADPSRSRPGRTGAGPDYHDPSAGIGGAPEARSALMLRLALAVFGFVVLAGLGALALARHAPGWATVSWVLALTAVADIVVVRRRQIQEN